MERDDDHAVTTVTDDGSFRVITARTTRTVTGVIDWQKARGASAEHLADLVTAAILVRLTMAPNLRVQAAIRGAGGRGTVVADSLPDGRSRGLLREPQGAIQLGAGAQVQVMRSLPNGTIQQGVVEVSSGHGIASAITTYMRESEQVTAVLGAGCLIADGKVVVAGGWLVQLLPECTEPPLALMYERLRHDFADGKAVLRELDASPTRLQAEILYGIESTKTAEVDLYAGCSCSAERVLASMASLGEAELRDILAKGETLHVSCDYCGAPYEVRPESLRALLTTT